jgi:hypothetical protein
MNSRISKYFFIFFIVVIIFSILFYTNVFIYNNFNFNEKEGMTNTGIVSGRMVGQIKRAMNPVSMNRIKRNVRKTVNDTFSNPTIEYYTNKLNQIFR